MRFLVLMLPNLPTDNADDWMPSADQVAEMSKFNQELSNAGVLLALDGLHPASEAVHVSFSNGKPKVIDGPFAEAKEVVGGYWILQCKSKEEAVEWARRCPVFNDATIEIRQIMELEEFPPDVQAAAGERLV
ncbi:MAG TPA: YciI family protein [Acidimicrobiia bacterium]|nr:YciI family protein [Acidimicrobiia bacterium]